MTRIKLVRRGQNPLPKRSPIQNSRTSHCLVVVWMSIAFSVSATRLFHHLTKFPAIGQFNLPVLFIRYRERFSKLPG